MQSKRRGWLSCFFSLAFVLSPSVKAADTQYDYDASGRLIAVIFSDGSRNEYAYDAIGNITSVGKIAPSPIWLAQMAPKTAPVGASVTFQGGGFSTNAVSNVVKFNGTQAAVTGATASSITATVPAAATTGKVTVTNTNGTASSMVDFVVAGTALGEAPQPISIGPNQTATYTFSAAAGDGLTLVLSGIATTPSATVVAGVKAPAGATLATCNATGSRSYCQLPYMTASGTYKVVVGAGASALKMQLAVVPDVRRGLVLADPQVKAAVLIPGQSVTYSFNGAIGQQNINVSILDNMLYGRTKFSVFRPDGIQLATTEVTYLSGAGSGGVVTLPSLPATGLYKMRASPDKGAVGSLAAALSQDANGTIAVDGAAVPIGLSNNRARYTFSGSIGQRLGIGVIGMTTTPAGGSVAIALMQPDGSTLSSCIVRNTMDGCTLAPLLMNGTHSLVLAPSSSGATLQLQLVSDLSAALTLNAPGAVLNLARIGQSATFNFSAVAGQTVNLALTGVTIPGSSVIEIGTPDGVDAYGVVAYSAGSGGNAFIVLPRLLTTGNYALRIKPQNGAVGSVMASLTQDKSGAIVVDGTPTAVGVDRQVGRYTFTGSVGQRLGLGFAAINSLPSGAPVTVDIVKPDGTELGKCAVTGTVNGCVLPVLPVVGTYTVKIASLAGSVALNMQLSTDIQATLEPNAAASALNIGKVGQAATYSFAGTAGQNVALVASIGTLSGKVGFEVSQPNGALIRYFDADKSSSVRLPINGLPQTGTYKVRLIPSAGAIGTATLVLRQDISGSLTIDGGAVPVNLSYQTARFSFAGTAGHRIGLSIAGLTTTPANTEVNIVLMDGDAILSECVVLKAADGCVLPILPATGPYTLVVRSSASSVSFGMQLASDVSGAITLNGPPVALSVAKAGQAASFSFNALAGKSLNVAVSGVTLPGTTFFELLDPSGKDVGGTVVTFAAGGGTGAIPLGNVAVSGTHILRAKPQQGSTGNVSATVAEDVGASLVVDGAALPVTLDHQSGRFTFAGRTGQRLGLGITGLSTTPAGMLPRIWMETSDGSPLDYCAFSSGVNSGCRFSALPDDGTYAIVVASTQSLSKFNLQLSSEVTESLVVDGPPATLNMTRAGQSGRFTFTGVAGQDLSLMLASVTIPGFMRYEISGPDGSLIAAALTYVVAGAPSSAVVPLGILTEPGEYAVAFAATGGPGTVTASVQQVIAGTPLVVNAGSAAASLQKKSVRFPFNGSAGQSLGLGLLNLVTTPAAGKVMFYVEGVNGETVQSGAVAASNGGMVLPKLQASGGYAVVLTGTSTSSAFNLQLNTDVTAALPVNGTPVTVNVPKFGQGATYTFDATAGQNLVLSLSGVTFPGVTLFKVMNADGTYSNMGYTNFVSGTSASTSLALSSLPTTGAYTVRVESPSGSPGSATASLR